MYIYIQYIIRGIKYKFRDKLSCHPSPVHLQMNDYPKKNYKTKLRVYQVKINN